MRADAGYGCARVSRCGETRRSQHRYPEIAALIALPGEPVPTPALLRSCCGVTPQLLIVFSPELCLGASASAVLPWWFVAFHLRWSTASPLPAVARGEKLPVERLRWLWTPRAALLVRLLPLSAFSVAESGGVGGRKGVSDDRRGFGPLPTAGRPRVAVNV